MMKKTLLLLVILSMVFCCFAGCGGTTADAEMRPEFKKAMDSYEAFIDDYIAFMKKYQENPSDASLIADYTTYMADYADIVADFEKWNNEELNEAEKAYYLEVQTKVSKKLQEVS